MVRIRFQELQIKEISGGSGLFSGSNKLIGFKHISKHNQAFGTVSGQDSRVSGQRSVLDDRDQIDMQFMRKSDLL
ncbi:hypothetical protein [Paenibacillus thermotolerans]|uniref:hypothetical protein n=1 Tax=Paenibacillus thermotolerans TaxID=3027807 RepID=UPI002368E33F|nr:MULTISPECIES: hypothetical protein [unclassified Paenibacillus]